MPLSLGFISMKAVSSSPSAHSSAVRLRRMSAVTQQQSNANVPSPDQKTVNVKIKGQVQGVFYRNWTVETAKQLGLNGWVRNRRDGSVEAVFSGKSSIVDTMLQKCHIGPPAAKVTGVDASAWNGAVPEGFERRTTE